jgi:hypothetical protein
MSYEQVRRRSEVTSWLLKLWGFLDGGVPSRKRQERSGTQHLDIMLRNFYKPGESVAPRSEVSAALL